MDKVGPKAQEIFEQLLGLKGKASYLGDPFSSELFSHSQWAKQIFFNNVDEPTHESLPEEKIDLIDGLEKFALDKASEEIAVRGGKIVKKAPATHLATISFKATDQRPIDVLFCLKRPEDERAEEVFNKMLLATKIGEDKRDTFYLDGQGDNDKFFHKLWLVRPQIVVALGGMASNMAMGNRERLQKIHGQFFDREIKNTEDEVYQFKVCALFHPDYLVINPKMKRTVWNDLKEVMKFVGVI